MGQTAPHAVTPTSLARVTPLQRIVRHVPAGEGRLISHGHSQVRQCLAHLSRQRQALGGQAQHRHRGRRVPRLRRPLRLWQVHQPAHARRPRGGQRGRHLHRRPQRHRPLAQGPRRRDGLPELRALPAHVGRRQHGLRPEDRRHQQVRDQQAGPGGCQDPRPRGVPRAQAEGPLRRSAPARGHGPGHRPPAAGLPDGRAAVQPRRQAPRPDPHPDRLAAAPARCHHGLRHARPGRGHDDG